MLRIEYFYHVFGGNMNNNQLGNKKLEKLATEKRHLKTVNRICRM